MSELGEVRESVIEGVDVRIGRWLGLPSSHETSTAAPQGYNNYQRRRTEQNEPGPEANLRCTYVDFPLDSGEILLLGRCASSQRRRHYRQEAGGDYG